MKTINTADWVLRKRGYFYRPNSQGYTSSIHEAGRYTEDEAKTHAAKGIDPPVTAHPATEFLGTIADISDERLLERAVKNCRARSYRKGVKHMRWIAVMETFGLGSGYSEQLCARFGVDPEERVTR